MQMRPKRQRNAQVEPESQGLPVAEIVTRESLRWTEVWQVRLVPRAAPVVALGAPEPPAAPEELRLFFARANDDGSDPRSLKYAQISMDSVHLAEVLALLRAAPLGMPPDPEERGVLDGTRYRLTVRGGVEAEASLSWNAGEVPAQWARMAQAVAIVLERLRQQRRAGSGR
jgi:hypothetical protein